MSSKIRVFGRTHNRTALGIVNAYLIIHPEATLEQIRVAFPNSINPISNDKEMFVDVTEKTDPSKLDGYFTRAEELLRMGQGKKVAMLSQWPLESLQRLIEKGKLYGIEVADYEPADSALGCKGGYYIEFLDNWKPAGAVNQILNIAPIAAGTGAVTAAAAASIPTDPDMDSLFGNNSPSNDNTAMATNDYNDSNLNDNDSGLNDYNDSNLNWLWVLIGLVVAGLFVWAICSSYQAQKLYANMDGNEFLALVQPGEATVEDLPLEIPEAQSQDGTEVVSSTQRQTSEAVNAEAAEAQEVDPQSYMARFTELQHQFNGIEYKNAKAVLSDSAKHVLNRVAALMEEYPSLDLRIEGHTSSVGRANYNQKLSQKRAEAVAAYLEGKGIAADRLVAVGMGEAKPVDPANPNGSDNRVTCLFNISHNEARAQKEPLADIVAQDVSEEGPITADF